MMSRCAPPHQPLGACRALYIGKAAPQSTFEGLDTIQKPLCELYRKSKWDPKKVFDHMESNVHVFSSGLLMRPCNPLDKDVWFKIQDLESCAAVKAYNDPSCRGRLLFVPCDSGSAAMSEHPPMFALIMKRNSGGIKISDCHAFICNSDRAALALVRATAHAFGNQAGWTDERPTLVQLGLERPEVKYDSECYVDDIKDDCTPEYYDKPKLSGFFYTPRSDLIQKFNVRGEDCYGRPIEEGGCMVKPFICDEFEPPEVVEQPCPPPAIVIVQNGGKKPHCHHNSYQSVAIAPQQPQIVKASKKGARVSNQYVTQNEIMYNQTPQHYTDPNGDQYLVDEQTCQIGCGDPLYTKFLPQNGMGDHGPPQMVEYVEYYGNVQPGAEVYSRKLPGQGGMGRSGGGRNYDGNFMMKKSDGYGMSAGYGINMGALSIGDQY